MGDIVRCFISIVVTVGDSMIIVQQISIKGTRKTEDLLSQDLNALSKEEQMDVVYRYNFLDLFIFEIIHSFVMLAFFDSLNVHPC